MLKCSLALCTSFFFSLSHWNFSTLQQGVLLFLASFTPLRTHAGCSELDALVIEQSRYVAKVLGAPLYVESFGFYFP